MPSLRAPNRSLRRRRRQALLLLYYTEVNRTLRRKVKKMERKVKEMEFRSRYGGYFACLVNDIRRKLKTFGFKVTNAEELWSIIQLGREAQPDDASAEVWQAFIETAKALSISLELAVWATEFSCQCNRQAHSEWGDLNRKHNDQGSPSAAMQILSADSCRRSV